MTIKVVLAYSGGLDTSVAIPWLKAQYQAEVVTLTADLGGGGGRSDVEERALAAGAIRSVVVDAKEDFVNQTGTRLPVLRGFYVHQFDVC